MNETWSTFRIAAHDVNWEPAKYNVQWSDGREYGRWRRVLRQHSHGLTVISRYTAPPGKAWKIVGKASELGEEVYILEGCYYDTRGRVIAGPGTYMFNAPGAIHGGISCDLTLFIHCCSGQPDEIVSVDLIDFSPGSGTIRASAHAAVLIVGPHPWSSASPSGKTGLRGSLVVRPPPTTYPANLWHSETTAHECPCDS